jgi:two-component system OmpR family response regulator
VDAYPQPVPHQRPSAAAEPERTLHPRVLVIEDDPAIVDFVRRGLVGAGLEVEAARNGLDGEARATRESFDAIILDLMLPGRGGLEVLAAVRARRPRVPVIIITARAEIDQRIAGLDAGAVDYVLKPFSVAELAARVRAQVRRTTDDLAATLYAADIQIDFLTREVRRAGIPVRLSSTEFEVLAHLVRRRGETCTYEELLAGIWGYTHDPGTNLVAVYVGYLRRKLARPGSPAPILTIRSIGYRLVG